MKFGGALHVFSTVAVVGFASACYTLLGPSIGDALNTQTKLESTLMASEERTRDELLEAIGDSKKEVREEILKAKKEIMVSHHPSNKTTTEPH